MELHFQTTSDRALVAVGQTIVALGEVEIYGRKLIKQCIEIFTKNRPSNPMVGTTHWSSTRAVFLPYQKRVTAGRSYTADRDGFVTYF